MMYIIEFQYTRTQNWTRSALRRRYSNKKSAQQAARRMQKKNGLKYRAVPDTRDYCYKR